MEQMYFLLRTVETKRESVDCDNVSDRVMPNCGGAPNMLKSRPTRCDWIPGHFCGKRFESSSSRRMFSTKARRALRKWSTRLRAGLCETFSEVVLEHLLALGQGLPLKFSPFHHYIIDVHHLLFVSLHVSIPASKRMTASKSYVWLKGVSLVVDLVVAIEVTAAKSLGRHTSPGFFSPKMKTIIRNDFMSSPLLPAEICIVLVQLGWTTGSIPHLANGQGAEITLKEDVGRLCSFSRFVGKVSRDARTLGTLDAHSATQPLNSADQQPRRKTLDFRSLRVLGVGIRLCVLSGESSRLLRTASHTVLLRPHCGRRLVRCGQDAESPRHAASPSKRAANPADENSRLTELVMNLEEKVSSLETEITVLNSELEDCRQVVQEMVSAFGGSAIADMRREMEQMSIQIGLLQRAVSNVPAVAPDAGARIRIPEPKAYSGQPGATGYLGTFAGSDSRAVFPENVKYNARRALRKLEHTGSVRDYVKTFSVLMLDIRDMSEKDKLFTFMEGLKPWARLELQRQRVTDLGSAMAAAERLTDFNPENRKDRQTTPSLS
ncbi:hypothetical protein Sango_2477300 [Sesamum angolense]|uniref:Retrotransposon gag domain-containing protein n=1 Tax=Sesamum angolense TaxID=2727404 RepID=A0AAE1W3H5_9LAMI|nr:hypothetical protein Sango_2477300 [Sesamum angolense]